MSSPTQFDNDYTTTPIGHLYVIWNTCTIVTQFGRNLEILLCGSEPGTQPNETYANTHAFMALTTMQHIFDSIATFCHRHYGHPEYNGLIYFNTYPFNQVETVWIRVYQDQLSQLKYRDMTFNEFCNNLKHHECYIGALARNTQLNMWDFFDGRQHLFSGLLKPAMNCLVQLINRLRAQTYPSMQVLPLGGIP